MEEKNYTLRSSFLGFFIGLAVIIPGFSGAQIAIIFKLYDKLMASLAHILHKKSILFLIPLAIGGIIGVVAGFIAIKYLLAISTIAVVCFFAGLMVGGMPSVFDEVKGSKFKNYYFLNAIIGLVIPVALSVVAINLEIDMSNLVTNPPLYFYFVALLVGVVLSLTQLVPGLSATSILLSLGLYTVLLDSLNYQVLTTNPKILLIFGMMVLGMIIGLLTISKFINKCLKDYKVGFYYLIIGLCFGSVFVMFYNPELYSIYTDMTPSFYIELAIGAALFVVGVVLVYFVYRYTRNKTLVKE